ncbi:ribonuclease E [Candidatus Pantoea edessiphila]|uniref:Ribonuclease G n=1 Tax=Candidatus Pantoea edessiphila TaxID=2044610 RepID=A0A2P5SZ04_9GAMM|nr:ribonuclease E [Candidatus Pantoea edessiphila]MBK4775346.1 ribonuclease E [Pantoea sp. Edef]PPI87520.1 ribonuclease E [Candidatus Pantoea edessiphila]
MKRMLINATQEEELRIALVNGQHLYDLDIKKSSHEQTKSNIYKGKIIRIEPSLEAVFVDYGPKRHGFLPIKEISQEYFSENYCKNNYNIKDIFKEGQELIVQVEKEERGNKGAALTTFVSLTGCYLILMPNNPVIGISRRIVGEKRIKIKEILSLLKIPENMGIIIRTAGLGKSIELLQWDLNLRFKRWIKIKKISNSKSAPFLIYQESNIIIRALRDYLRHDISEVLIDNPKVLAFARKQINEIGRYDFFDKIKSYDSNIPLFSHYQIESQIESAFQRAVSLPSGGSIVIDTTEALTAIDINSARSTKGKDIETTALSTNLEAAGEIARQIRLRDLSGLIVIDFIDMIARGNQRIVEDRFREEVDIDRARLQIGNISCFGLLEMSRQRLNLSLCESYQHECSRCNGTGTIRDNKSLSLSILRIIEEEAIKSNTKEVHAIVPVQVASYLLNEQRDAINAIEKRQNGVRTAIVPSIRLENPNYSVLRVGKGEETKILGYNLSKLQETTIFTSNKENVINHPRIKQSSLEHVFISNNEFSSREIIANKSITKFKAKPLIDDIELNINNYSFFSRVVLNLKQLFVNGIPYSIASKNNIFIKQYIDIQINEYNVQYFRDNIITNIIKHKNPEIIYSNNRSMPVKYDKQEVNHISIIENIILNMTLDTKLKIITSIRQQKHNSQKTKQPGINNIFNIHNRKNKEKNKNINLIKHPSLIKSQLVIRYHNFTDCYNNIIPIIFSKKIELTSSKFYFSHSTKNNYQLKQIKTIQNISKKNLNYKPNKSIVILSDYKIIRSNYNILKKINHKNIKLNNDKIKVNDKNTKHINHFIVNRSSLEPLLLNKNQDRSHNNKKNNILISNYYVDNKILSSNNINIAFKSISKNRTRWKYFASAPMTKVPIPVWKPDPIRFSDWVRPKFNFNGKGSAGGHSATHHVAAPATKPL